jgi:hypothetical protein
MCKCPYCDEELEYHDYYGRLCAHQDGKVLGEIYKCPNEECESACFNYYFHTREHYTDLFEGYPC